MSEFFLRGSGFTTRKSFSLNFLVSLTIFIGIELGFLLVDLESVTEFLMGISAGAFLQIVVHDLFPYREVVKIKYSSAWKHIVLFVFGVAIIILIRILTPHSHIWLAFLITFAIIKSVQRYIPR
jgi:zinc transporter ZupT